MKMIPPIAGLPGAISEADGRAMVGGVARFDSVQRVYRYEMLRIPLDRLDVRHYPR